MAVQGSEWIERLPADLAGQREILRRLLAWCEADDTVRWLVIGCSMARGAGDRLSDLDLALGVRPADFDAALPQIRQVVKGLGDLVDSHHHQLPSVTAPHERIFAQFADRCQVDLVVFPASEPIGSVAHVLVLYDPGDIVAVSDHQPPVTAGQIREWAFRGWCALADAGKYLRRQSPWEALNQLNQARAELWQLHAAASHIPQPQYGLTSILDYAPGQIPPDIERTVCDLDPACLLSAARHLAALINQVSEQLPAEQQAELPDAMARFVTDDLSSI
jgi:hypothetical protein